jgi:simple sugar transport system permease protein
MSAMIIGLFSSMFALCVPLLIAAEGEVFVERSGQFNMGIEGMMGLGAIAGFATTLATGSSFLGFIAGGIIGGLLAIAMFLLIYKLQLDMLVVAIVFNLLATGIAGFLATLFINSSSIPIQCKKLADLHIPFLSDIPILGPILFSRNYMVYIAILSVPVIAYILYKRKFGLELRAVGGNAAAAQTMGIDVFKTKMKCFLIGGVSGGVAGAYLSLTLGMFVENMTMNKGFIALALCTFSKGKPYGTLVGALIFALADSIQLRFQLIDIDIPYEFLLMLPYVLTIIVLTVSAKRSGGERKFA